MTYLIEATAVLAALYFATCFVAGLWNYQPRIAPSAIVNEPAPTDAPTPHPEPQPTVEVLPPDNAAQHLQQHSIRQLKAIATDFNRRLGQRHPNRVRNVGRLTKSALIEALLPRYEALRLVA